MKPNLPSAALAGWAIGLGLGVLLRLDTWDTLAGAVLLAFAAVAWRRA